MQRPIARWAKFLALLAAFFLLNVDRTVALTERRATLASRPASLSKPEIDQLVAPVALYPDALLANVLIASTYPLEIVIAARWTQGNKGLSGDKLTQAAAQQSWDESIKTLVHAPAVLAIMSKQIDWTNKLGEAFLAQQTDVFDAVQRLRSQALEADKLQTSTQQTVTTADNIVYIEPASAAMYVPYYDANDAYGLWLWDDHPPYAWPPPPGFTVTKGIFATAVVAGVWTGRIDYAGHRLTIDNKVERFARRDSTDGEAWRHDASHRQSMNYANLDLQTKFRGAPAGGDRTRTTFRGFSPPTGQFADGGTRRDARSGVDRGGGFSGIGYGNDTRGFSDRGYSSRAKSIGGFSGFRGGSGPRGSASRGGSIPIPKARQ